MSNSHRTADSILCEEYDLYYGSENVPPVVTVESDWGMPKRMQELATTIETAIIPRLLLSHRAERQRVVTSANPISAIGPATVKKLAKHLVSPDNAEAEDFVDDLLGRGMPMDVVLLDVMAPAARVLGEMWTADLCTFVDVTLGLSRMHKMLRKWSGELSVETGGPGAGHSALLVPAPGEQHTFGLRIVEEFLLRDGWNVRSNLKATHDETIDLVASNRFDVIGFTLSGETLLKPLISVIAAVRQTSQNCSIRVIVGGVMFVEQPELHGRIGADAFARDAMDAVRQANAWVQPVSFN
jgi:methanogenic corrinoid protein MtbC1